MEYLAHYGVKGMKWGKRKALVEKATNRIVSDAQSDAHEVMRETTRYGYKNESDKSLREIARRHKVSVNTARDWRSKDDRAYKRARAIATETERYNTLKKRGKKRIKDYVAMAQSLAKIKKAQRDVDYYVKD